MAQARSGSAPREDEFISGSPGSICCICDDVLERAQQTACGHHYCVPCLVWTRRNRSAVCLKCEEEPSSLSEDSYLAEDKKHNCEKTFSKDPDSRKSDPRSKGKDPRSPAPDCRFAPLGCTYRGSRDKMAGHEESAAAAHVALVLPALLQIQDAPPAAAVMENGSCDHNGGVQRSPARIHDGESAHKGIGCSMTGRISALEARIQVAENIIMVMNREIDASSAKLSAALEEIEQEHRKVQAAEAKISGFYCTIGRKDIEINELQGQMAALEQTTYDGVFLWRISDFTRKRQDASAGRTISLYSPAFYTARYGYKVCLRVYLNGDGAGKGSHVSLFFAIMKGEYDVLLSWPFRHKVTFLLLDQSNREHIIDAFRPDTASVSFQRPVADMNVASGCPLFCPLAKLQSPSSTYVMDDTIFIRCIIDAGP